MKYNWQLPDWPRFTFSKASVDNVINEYNKAAHQFIGSLDQLPQEDRETAIIDLLVGEATNTSAIEGKHLNRNDVRSSLKNYLGMNTEYERVVDPHAEGIAALMVDVRIKFDQPLTKALLCQWQSMVVSEPSQFTNPLIIGTFRNCPEPMQVVSGPIGNRKVHYEAPPSQALDSEIGRFLEWYEATKPREGHEPLAGPVRAAIAHLWFVSVHPFDDGNGRVARAIAEHALYQSLGEPSLVGLSLPILDDRKGYYQQLESIQNTLDATPWVEWFANITLQAQLKAQEQIAHVLGKVRFWDEFANSDLSDRQTKVINKLFACGYDFVTDGLNARKYMSMATCSKATATRDLSDLVTKGCLVIVDCGKRTRYQMNIPKASFSLKNFADRVNTFRDDSVFQDNQGLSHIMSP
jgi:Fic family protein